VTGTANGFEHVAAVAERLVAQARGATIAESGTRMKAACDAFAALDHDEQRAFANRISETCQAGEPPPPFNSLRDEAANWVALASAAELGAYLAAIWRRINQKQRQGFLDWIDRNANGKGTE
jgi:hypothetical protein